MVNDRYDRGFEKLKEIDGEAGERVIESLKDMSPWPDFNEMLDIVWGLLRRFVKIHKIYIDGSNPSFIRALKIRIGEDEEYEEVIKEAKSKKRNYEFSMDIVPVSFAAEHRSMLGNCKMFLERDGGYIAINSNKFDKLITSLRTAVEYNDGVLDKEATSYDDIFDAFRLAMCYYRFTESRSRSLLSI